MRSKSNQVDTTSPSPEVLNKNNLVVTAEFLTQQLDKATAKREKPTGSNPPGLIVPASLRDGIEKQTKKIEEMIAGGYRQPLDFIDLAEKRSLGELIELPLATETYVLDADGKADGSEFSSFSFENGSTLLTPDSPKFITLNKLAGDFDGTKYDLKDAGDRKQLRLRLLRKLNPETQKVLEEIAAGYQLKFNRPLKINSMTRSMDYQIELNKVDSNTYKVRGKESTPPHLSGCVFDIARLNLTAEEQNFMMELLNEMETNGRIDALIIFGETPETGFHIFVYTDGKPPKI